MTSKGKHIVIKGAHMHNLKNLDVTIQANSFTVVTGVSGSGKSSLVFDTLFAEGQRRYVESLSSYARQFLGRMNKPEVDFIEGLAPAIAIEQKVNTRNPRSTVATSTEIYDYLKLLFARAGHTYSPISGMEVKRHTVEDVVKAIEGLNDGDTAMVLSKLNTGKQKEKELLVKYQQQGFSRLMLGDKITKIEDLLADKKMPSLKDAYLVIDRLSIDRQDEELSGRAADSVDSAFWEGEGTCYILTQTTAGSTMLEFSNKFELDGVSFEIPTQDFLSFNNPIGACRTCEGYGQVIGVDEDLVVPDKSLSVYEGCVQPWKGEAMSEWREEFVRKAVHEDFPIHRAYYDLSDAEKDLLWQGNKNVKGINDFFKYLEEKSYKIQYRVMLSRYRGRTTCPDCKGTRLRKDAGYVKIVAVNPSKQIPAKISLPEILLMPVSKASHFFDNLKLDATDEVIAKRILTEIRSRLKFLNEVGLGYLGLNRLSNTLSGGESQRINLATSLGSSLTGSMYILDEPSIGLHPRDTKQLVGVLKTLQDLGNTVVVVEHEEEVMRAADDIIDIGPYAGTEGGNLVYMGDFKGILKDKNSLTGQYLSNRIAIPVPAHRRTWKHFIDISGARENNLKNITVRFPLETLTVVTGVSGSGKTTLVKNIVYPAIQKATGGYSGAKTGHHDRIEGDLHLVKGIEMIDQNPIGKSSRSNPVTYVKAYDAIRDLYAVQPLAKTQKLKPSHFSFNVDGGRCEHCKGEGETVIEMQFMADLTLPCEFCQGKRFKEEILEVTYNGKNISEILHLTVSEAIVFFEGQSAITSKLEPLERVGLGYVQLGQSSNTLSGGEAQRIKLASFLTKGQNKENHTIFIFDEPTTGLHFHDINKLMDSFNALIEKGHSVLIIEHNMDVIKCADWVIDLGPEGGSEGGHLVFAGTPEDLLGCKESYTGKFLTERLKSHAKPAAMPR